MFRKKKIKVWGKFWGNWNKNCQTKKRGKKIRHKKQGEENVIKIAKQKNRRVKILSWFSMFFFLFSKDTNWQQKRYHVSTILSSQKICFPILCFRYSSPLESFAVIILLIGAYYELCFLKIYEKSDFIGQLGHFIQNWTLQTEPDNLDNFLEFDILDKWDNLVKI